MRRIQSIQCMRGVAALAVVVFHLFENLKTYTGQDINALTGRVHIMGLIGVDVFFCISGFVMMAVLARGQQAETRLEFMTRRFIRIVPYYWLLTSALLAAHVAQALINPHFIFPRPAYIAGSYLFIPMENHQGEIAPILSPGWTLSFEMFFYLVLCVALPKSLEQVLRVTAAIFGVLVLLGAVFHPAAPLLGMITSPLLIEFIFGMLIFVAFQGRSAPSPRTAMLCFAACALILGYTHASVLTGPWQRLAIRGVPSALLLLGIMQLDQSWRCWRWTPLLLLGDASYSLYLTHDIVLPLLLRAWFRLGSPPLWAVVGGSLAAAVLVGLAFYRWVEQPMLRIMNRYLLGPRHVSKPTLATT